MKFISFYIPNCSLYLIIISIIRTINDIIKKKESTKKYFDNPLFSNFLMYIGESLSTILYLYQNYSNDNKTKNEIMIQKNTKFFLVLLIFISSLCDFLSSFRYNHLYNYKMRSIDNQFTSNFGGIVLFICFYLNEKYFLNIKTYRHHYIGIGINLIPLISFLLYYFIENKNLQYNLSLVYLLIIELERNYLLTIWFIICKKLNYQYFLNMNLILFIVAIFGILIVIVFQFLNLGIFKIEKLYLFYFEGNNLFSISDIIILFIYCILICLLNIYYLKVVEETRPIYNSLSKGLSNIFIDISHLIQYFFLKNNNYNKVLDFQNVILKTFALIGFLIYSEMITLNFCDLDKFTKIKTADRGEEDNRTINDLNLSTFSF